MGDVSFKDQVVIITGGGGGLGRAYALDIAARGGSVVINDLGGAVSGEGASNDMADRVVEEIRAAGGTAIANYDSVATVEGGEKIAAAALNAFGRIDALINNAGNLRNAAFADLAEEDRNALWAVHLAGPFNVSQPVFRQMAKQGYGRIVLTSSAAGLFGNPDQTAYAAAKAAAIGLMNVIAIEGAPHGILCNTVAPMAASRMGEKISPEHAAEMGKLIGAFGAALTPAFVAPLTVYLASDACQTSHDIYSAVGGRYSRIFLGLAEGWLGPRDAPVSAETVAEQIGAIRDISKFGVPGRLTDEFHQMNAQIAAAS